MGRQELARESQGPVLKLVSRGKGTCGVREDSDCSVKVCVDLVVGTDGVLKGQDQRGFSRRHSTPNTFTITHTMPLCLGLVSKIAGFFGARVRETSGDL